MGTNRRRLSRTRRGLSTLGRWDRFALRHGPRLGHTADDLVELWQAHGAEVLAGWIAERPGTRPWAWWRFEAPEPRRVVNLPRHPGSGLERDGSDGRRRGGQVLIGADGAPDLVPWLEEEWEYLSRLGLLEPGEAEAIDDEADDD